MSTHDFREQPTVRIRPPQELLERDRDPERRLDDDPRDEREETTEPDESALMHRPPTLGSAQPI